MYRAFKTGSRRSAAGSATSAKGHAQAEPGRPAEASFFSFFFFARKVMLTETVQGRNASMQTLGKGAFPEGEGRYGSL